MRFDLRSRLFFNRNYLISSSRDCQDFNVLGLDCEWVPDYGQVAMLQLATGRGNIYLIRTCKMKKIPDHLKVRKEIFQ